MDLFSNVSEDLFSNVAMDFFSKGNVFLLQLQPARPLPRDGLAVGGAVQWPEGNYYLLAVGGSCCLLGGAAC